MPSRPQILSGGLNIGHRAIILCQKSKLASASLVHKTVSPLNSKGLKKHNILPILATGSVPDAI
jgi:hypothetical protein